MSALKSSKFLEWFKTVIFGIVSNSGVIHKFPFKDVCVINYLTSFEEKNEICILF